MSQPEHVSTEPQVAEQERVARPTGAIHVAREVRIGLRIDGRDIEMEMSAAWLEEALRPAPYRRRYRGGR